VCIPQILASVGLRDEGVHTQQQAGAEKYDHVVKALTKTRGPDGDRAIGHAADHNRVYHAHAHPSDFSHDERQRQAQGQAKIAEAGRGLKFSRHGSCDFTVMRKCWRSEMPRSAALSAMLAFERRLRLSVFPLLLYSAAGILPEGCPDSMVRSARA
jgi:hypothetical protein